MNGKKLVKKLKKSLCGDSTVSDIALARKLGFSSPNIANLKKNPTERRIVSLVNRAIRSSQKNSIVPIVEFFDIDPDESRQRKKMEIFSPSTAKKHPYLNGLKEELKGQRGIYLTTRQII